MKLLNMTWKLLLAGSLACQVACTADGATTLVILRNQAPAEGCSIPSSEGGEFRPSGRIDVRSAIGYRFTPLVQNVAVASENSTRRIFVNGANVDITFEGANPPTPSAGLENSISFRSPFSGSIEAGGTSTFDFDIVTRELLADLVDDVTPDNPVQITAKVTIVGDLDGDGVDSNTFNYPIEICDGCLLQLLGACSDLSESGTFNQGGVCNPLQDGLLDCCTAQDGSLTCPAVGTML